MHIVKFKMHIYKDFILSYLPIKLHIIKIQKYNNNDNEDTASIGNVEDAFPERT